jgi:hypothetical protein
VTRMIRFIAVAVAISTGIAGCGPGGTPTVETVKAPTADPVAEAKAILTNYANGMPVTSEAESFPELVAKVKEKDAAKGEMLDKGFSQIKANPASAQATAKGLLPKL